MAGDGRQLTRPAVPLVAEHDSWITVDPIVGCPADCAYCYLGPLGLRATRPAVRATPEMAVAAVEDHLGGRRAGVVDPAYDQTPLCVGNYTDMVLTRPNRDALVRIVELLAERIPRRPVVVVTKGRLDPDLLAALDRTGFPIFWFLSQSMARPAGVPLERGRIADLDTTLDNARLVSRTTHQKAVHFWRPFVAELRPSRADLEKLVGRLATSGLSASVAVGLTRGPGVPLWDERLVTLLDRSMAAPAERWEVFDDEGWAVARESAAAAGYPLYRNTSCALAFLGGRPEALGTWRPPHAEHRCLPAACPLAQRGRCATAALTEEWTDGATLAARVAAFLGLDPGLVSVTAGKLLIDDMIDEFDYNTLLHGYGRHLAVRAQGVRRQKAWLGSFTGGGLAA
ncbi:hypothetical protein RB614_22095 [Phytohabitans sp. ZYX-F-186]|uniref:Radical SAM protein n=1 Tax=Phytohabitans maris TaxID=3071409 RepID=A0ABU0ZLE3_9ACTN|nr:hypothetical protein [Phytohabitans sp. ZYX-F-186]MDQ7907209.1 hypothetical protein [Phytohabitans sp. ZYX-F-186]